MYKIAKPLFLIAETPVHAGSGSDLGYIDNPIQREKHTGYPKIEASSLKGALRQAFEANKEADFITIHRVFGYDGDGLTKDQEKLLENAFGDQKDFAGAIGFTDARILLFPVKSLKGTFAYVTCPRVLVKFKNELTEICKVQVDFEVPTITDAQVTKDCNLKTSNNPDKIQLDEYSYHVDQKSNDKEDINKLAKFITYNVFTNSVTIADITKNLVIVPDDDFADFVKFGTEVSTHIKIDNETGTVKDGALFTVEYLPTETVMYSLAMFSPEFRAGSKFDEKEVERFFNGKKPDYFQLGGDATTGKGIMKLQVPTLAKIKEEAKS
jgi:CRISPR-associated protein Cmr4